MSNLRANLTLMGILAAFIAGAATDNYNLAKRGYLQPNLWGFKPKPAATPTPEATPFPEQADGRYITLYRADGLSVTIMLHCPKKADFTIECQGARYGFDSAVSSMKKAGFQEAMVMRSHYDIVYSIDVHAGRHGSGVTYSVKTFGGAGTMITLTRALGNGDRDDALPARLKSLHGHYIAATKALAAQGADVIRVTTKP